MTSKKLILGISGGIAAYKIPLLIRQLKKEGFAIQCILTENAKQFVTKTSLAAVSKTTPLESLWEEISYNKTHIQLAHEADMFIIAPATANIIAKCAAGIADDLLTTLFLAFTGPKLIVPAMHSEMYLNPITQRNIQTLKQTNVHFLGPDKGDLASDDNGIGRMVDIPILLSKIQSLTYPPISLKGTKILITAGGTKEPIDNMRIITNHSTGQLGHALANTASFLGADVTLITTIPPKENNPEISKTIIVETAAELKNAIEKHITKTEYLFMAAAVSDFSCEKSPTKIKRQDSLSLKLTATTDIVKSIATTNKNKIITGFCLEDTDLEATAQKKLMEKNLDFIIANTSKSIGQPKRSLIIFDKKNPTQPLHLTNLPLPELTYHILKYILLDKQTAGGGRRAD